MVICCAEGSWIKVERVKSQGKREVGVNDWWNGLPRGVREEKSIKLGS
jgi:methionyl-tRNA formyltransferase